ncbi:MAG: VWA domain-containing protein, partial [Candidatus Bipolaricaulia bacterium]
LDLMASELDDPDHGLAEIKAEVRALEAKVDKIWRCLSGLEIRYEELPGKVERAPVDVILAIDSSGSMKTNDPRRLRITTAKQFIEQLDPQRDQAGVVSWDNDIDFVQPLTGDLALAERKIERVDASGATNLNAGLSAAIDEFVRGRPETKRVIIFLTDGDGTYTFSGQSGSPAALARQKGITIYAIGLGGAPSRKKLEDMATATGGRFYLAPTAEDLKQIYEEISKQLVVPAERVMKLTCPTD